MTEIKAKYAVHEFHVAVLGAAEVGKTSMINRLLDIPFDRKGALVVVLILMW
jgi:GTPase SAR1 family protein